MKESARILERIYSKIINRIIQTPGVEKIILFGSYAYGKPHKDSDIDLFIVMKTEKRPVERGLIFQELFQDREFAMDFIVKTPEEVNYRISIGDFFVKKILEEGQVLYEH